MAISTFPFSRWNSKILLSSFFRKVVGVEVKRLKQETAVSFSKAGMKWDCAQSVDGWIGGRYDAENHSKGYHGILRQWWEHYNHGTSCLLISENNNVKARFQLEYPGWSFVTLDKFDNLGEPTDKREDLCGTINLSLSGAFDLIICQATLEHVYDPFTAIKNMMAMLRPGGVVLIHTHTPSFRYHACPRDYFRFQIDWFHDIPQFVSGSDLLELYATKGHVFAAFRKVSSKDGSGDKATWLQKR